MLQALCSKWWCLTLRGLCAVIAGVISVMHPELTITFLVILIGVLLLKPEGIWGVKEEWAA